MAGNRHDVDWYLNIVLATVTGLLFLVGLVINIIGFAMLVVVPCVLWFWIRMLTDYFRNRPDKNPVAWGWALFMLTFAAALAYFWVIWRPRNRQHWAT